MRDTTHGFEDLFYWRDLGTRLAVQGYTEEQVRTELRERRVGPRNRARVTRAYHEQVARG